MRLWAFFTVAIMVGALVGCGSGGSATDIGGGGGSGSGLALAWDRSPDQVAGYKVYYGGTSGFYDESFDVGNETEASLAGVPAGFWCFALTAYNDSMVESGYSNEVCATIQ